jgi:hypothetical protein
MTVAERLDRISEDILLVSVSTDSGGHAPLVKLLDRAADLIERVQEAVEPLNQC